MPFIPHLRTLALACAAVCAALSAATAQDDGTAPPAAAAPAASASEGDQTGSSNGTLAEPASSATVTPAATAVAVPRPRPAAAARTAPPAAEPVAGNADAATAAPEAPAASRSSWGWGLGYVFTEIPISKSEFSVFMTDLHYSYLLNDPAESLRTSLSLGLFGFALILPVPKLSAEVLIGRPTQDIQGKLGVGGFYDITVGGTAGGYAELGLRIKNLVDVSFLAVPAGTDSERDYLDFLGLRKEGEVAKKPYVVYPYYGLFITFNY